MRSKVSKSIILALLSSFLPVLSGPLLAPAANAVTTSTSGTAFVAVITPNLGSATPYLYLSARSSGLANIYYPNGTETSVALTGGVVQTVLVPTSEQMATSDQGEVNKAIRVTSTVPITLYGCTYNQYTSDCTNYTPVAVWGKRYRPLSNPQANDRITMFAGSETATVTVTFKNSVTANGSSQTAGSTSTFTIPAYKVYTLLASSSGENFSGSLVTSNQPIGLIAGNDCANVISGACDALMEMVPSESSLGKNFFVNNYASNNKGTLVRVVAAETGTILNISGDETITANLDEGGVYSKVFFSTGGNRAIKIASNKPILVAKLMPGSGQYDSGSGQTTGDPALSYMPPYEQYLSDYVFVNAPNFIAQFINVTIPASALASLRLDGVLADTSRFISLPTAPEWKIGVIYTTTGTHRMTANLPFGLEVYGANNYNSYAYVGGASYVPLASITSLTSAADTSTADTGGFACITTTVTDTNTAPIAGARVDATIDGVNSSQTPFGITDENGLAQICYRGLTVGADTMTVTVNGLTQTINVTWSAPSNPPVWVTNTLDTLTVGTYSGITLNAGAWETLTISSGSLPPGLSFDATTGEITGTPTTSGAYSVTFSSTNAAGTTNRTFSGTVVTDGPVSSPAPSPAQSASVPVVVIQSPTFLTVPTYSLTEGSPARIQINASNGTTYEIVNNSLPAGLSLNAATGLITGTPIKSGSFQVTIISRNDGGGTSATFTFEIKAKITEPVEIDKSAETIQVTPPSLDGIPTNASAAKVGGGLIKDGELILTSAIKSNSSQNGVLVSAQGWSLSLAAIDQGGNPSALNSLGQVIIRENQSAKVSGQGFKPNSQAHVYIFSQEIRLGILPVDSSGNFAGLLPVPNSLDEGVHVLQVNGISTENKLLSASVPVVYQKNKNEIAPVLISAKKVVIPFAYNSYQVRSTQKAILKMVEANPGSKIRILGYAQPSKSQPDIAISLDRALEVKSALMTFVSASSISVRGNGSKTEPLCKKYKNKCAVVTIERL